MQHAVSEDLETRLSLLSGPFVGSYYLALEEIAATLEIMGPNLQGACISQSGPLHNLVL